MKSSFCIDLQRFMLIPTKFPLSPNNGITRHILGTAKTCLEGNTHRLADVGNRGQA